MVLQLRTHTHTCRTLPRCGTQETEASSLLPQHLGHRLAGGKNKVSSPEKLSRKKTHTQVVNTPLAAYQLNYVIS